MSRDQWQCLDGRSELWLTHHVCGYHSSCNGSYDIVWSVFSCQSMSVRKRRDTAGWTGLLHEGSMERPTRSFHTDSDA